jgi:hypothetical protein
MIFNYLFTKLIPPNRKLTTSFILVFVSYSMILGQVVTEQKPPFKDRLFYGGSFGLQFGTYTDIQVSPVIGLWLLPRVAAAVGPEYRFYKDPNGRTNIYGGRGYLQLVVFQNINKFIPVGVNTGIFLHAEDEMMSLESSVWRDPNSTGRFYVNTILAGGGLSQQIGRRSSLNIIFLWALNDSGYAIYNNPEIRVSFIF